MNPIDSEIVDGLFTECDQLREMMSRRRVTMHNPPEVRTVPLQTSAKPLPDPFRGVERGSDIRKSRGPELPINSIHGTTRASLLDVIVEKLDILTKKVDDLTAKFDDRFPSKVVTDAEQFEDAEQHPEEVSQVAPIDKLDLLIGSKLDELQKNNHIVNPLSDLGSNDYSSLLDF